MSWSRLILASLLVLLTFAGELAGAQTPDGSSGRSSQPAKKHSSVKSAKKTAGKSSGKTHGKAKKNQGKMIAGKPSVVKTSMGKALQPKFDAPIESGRLSRDIVFDGSNVNGQYHSAGEAVARVEQEKKMNNLIGIRTDFKDRLSAERESLKRGETASAQ